MAGRREAARRRGGPEGTRDLPETREVYDLLIEHATEMISRHRPGDRAFEFASPASRRILGYPPEELAGRALDDLVHPPDLAAVAAAFAAAAGAGAPVSFRARHRDGRLVWLESTCTAVAAGQAGPLPGVLAVSREITRFKELERAIERVAQEWRGTFDAASDVIILLDDRLRVARANRAAVQLFDRPFADLLWQPVAVLLRALDPGPRGGLRLANPRRLKRRWEREVHLAAKKAWVLLSLDPIRDGDGKPSGAVLVLRDITERKRAEIALRDSLEQLRSLSARLETAREQERTRIARDLHDELGHALTALKMDVAWLTGRLGSADQALAERGAAMPALIDRTVATVRAISTELRPSLLDELGLLAAIEWQAAEFGRRTGIATRVSGPPAPPALDAERAIVVFRILQEALTNVARHAEAGSVSIALKPLRTRIVLEVRDDGRGVLPAEAAGPGSLGILGMRERARSVEGRMTLTGRPGRGTTVRLSIPKFPAVRAR